MAAEQNLVTKARLEQIKTAEAGLVDNLYAHANASLSKAHGIVYYRVGSDYQDSHGDVVGTALMRLTYNNVNYYAPINSSTLAGKDPTTGITPDVNVGVVAAVIPGGTAWVTDFTPEDEQDLIVTNDSILLPHTLLSHWETHSGGIYQVLPQIVTDSAGHRVSNYVARILVDGTELWIPCDPRLGGPIQPTRVAFPAINTLQGTNSNYCAMGRDNQQYGYFWYSAATGGTPTATFRWEVNSYQPIKIGSSFWSDPLTGSGIWSELTGASGSMAPGGPIFNPVNATYLYTGNKLTITTFLGGNNQRVVATVRGKWTNPAGIVYTNWCLFVANDEDGSWIFSDPDFNQSATHVPITNDPTWVDGYYTPPGPP